VYFSQLCSELKCNFQPDSDNGNILSFAFFFIKIKVCVYYHLLIFGGLVMRIGVICGGFGPERSISLKSGKAVFHSLREGGKDDILCLDPAGITLNRQNETVFSDSDSIDEKANRGIAYRDCLQRFRDFRAEIIFIALHGSDGEDGHLQALLDMLGVAYTGSGPLACQLSMDKDIAKRLAGFGGVRTADWVDAG
jgi:D-alanine-D-alanine ligase